MFGDGKAGFASESNVQHSALGETAGLSSKSSTMMYDVFVALGESADCGVAT